jgi:predicted DNA-binding WGR domain protein
VTYVELYSHTYHHPDGKQYLLGLVRDHADKMGACYVVRNWGKHVYQDFSAGQISVTYFPDYHQAASDFNREHNKRISHGYVHQNMSEPVDMDRSWVDITGTTEEAVLQSKGVDFSKFGNGPGSLSLQNKLMTGGAATTYSYDANSNEVITQESTVKIKKEVDPDAVPGPRTGGAKRLEWVVTHPEHPQAFDQMMQVASQMATERDKAATTVASIDNDLEFVKAWLAQQMTKAG